MNKKGTIHIEYTTPADEFSYRTFEFQTWASVRRWMSQYTKDFVAVVSQLQVSAELELPTGHWFKVVSDVDDEPDDPGVSSDLDWEPNPGVSESQVKRLHEVLGHLTLSIEKIQNRLDRLEKLLVSKL